MTLSQNKNIFEAVIQQDLCVGCGACLYAAPGAELKMDWNSRGFLVPVATAGANTESKAAATNTESKATATNTESKPSATATTSTTAGAAESLRVCPFNPWPEEAVKTEDQLADLFLTEAPHRHPKVGHYYNTYAGYSTQYRPTSSSGGLATYLIDALLKSKKVDAVMVVKEGRAAFYEYGLLRAGEDCTAASKTRYYPVTMAGLMEQLRSGNERYAVVGIACFIKAIRLLQYYHPELNEKIKFSIGIICGGLKSRFFAEYLAGRAGADSRQFSQPQFRIKDTRSTASDYSYACSDQQGRQHSIKMRTVGDMWGTGLFKNNACDFCDDVTAELADISLGDAWLSPYKNDGKGTNVIVTRSRAAEEFIHQGIESKDLIVEPLAFDCFLHSQQGSFYHRHQALGYRIMQAQKQGAIVPPKRRDQEKIGPVLKQVQNQRRLLRRLSLRLWAAGSDSAAFDRALRKPLFKLKVLTRINHYRRAILKKIKA